MAWPVSVDHPLVQELGARLEDKLQHLTQQRAGAAVTLQRMRQVVNSLPASAGRLPARLAGRIRSVTVADVVQGIGSLDSQLQAAGLTASLVARRIESQRTLLENNEMARGTLRLGCSWVASCCICVLIIGKQSSKSPNMKQRERTKVSLGAIVPKS